MGVVILGLSTDPPGANAAFAAKYGFPFPLLSDLERRVCRAYGACEQASDVHALRVTYVVDPAGRIAEVHEDIDTVNHAAILMASLAQRAGRAGPAPAYVLGRLGAEVATEARRDALAELGLHQPEEPAAVLAFLDRHPESATALVWTLAVDGVPLYAVRGAGAFAAEVYAGLRRLLAAQLAGPAGEEGRVAVPGRVAGMERLSQGHAVPILWAEPRGLRAWPSGPASEAAPAAPGEEGLLARLSAELRNRGFTPRERALNFAVSAPEGLGSVYGRLPAGLTLAGLGARPAPLCRPGSDCWDVELALFDPAARHSRSGEAYRLTVDVSDVVPVALSRVRHWQVDRVAG